jgi:CubicO group peptidase (beta-lactamase class C family)
MTSWLLTLSLLSLTSLPLAGENTVEIPEVSRVIERHFPQGSSVGVGVLITRNGEVIHRKGYGTVKGKALTPQSSLRLASISNQFAAMGAAVLIEEGNLDLKTQVSRYLPEVKLPIIGRELLVQDLLWHTCGLPNFINKKEKASITEFRQQRGPNYLTNQTHAEWLATMPPVREPGTLWEYTNSGYVLLARLIEVIAGEPFHRF